jgi:hypothetical protein
MPGRTLAVLHSRVAPLRRESPLATGGAGSRRTARRAAKWERPNATNAPGAAVRRTQERSDSPASVTER